MVAVINDLSGFGKCSLVADIAVLSAMGIEVCPVPTAILSAQTGFLSYHMQDTKDYVGRCTEEWMWMNADFEGILTGYIPQEKIAGDITEFVNVFRKKGALLLVDPVMGDGGRCYSNYSEGLRAKIKELASSADVITPNLTELCILAGKTADYADVVTKSGDIVHEIKELACMVRANKRQSIVITGIITGEIELCNLVVGPEETELIRSTYNGRSYSGTGDLFAASLFGNILKGKGIVEATFLATDFISRSIGVTSSKDRNYGVDFEKVLSYGVGGEK